MRTARVFRLLNVRFAAWLAVIMLAMAGGGAVADDTLDGPTILDGVWRLDSIRGPRDQVRLLGKVRIELTSRDGPKATFRGVVVEVSAAGRVNGLAVGDQIFTHGRFENDGKVDVVARWYPENAASGGWRRCAESLEQIRMNTWGYFSPHLWREGHWISFRMPIFIACDAPLDGTPMDVATHDAYSWSLRITPDV